MKIEQVLLLSFFKEFKSTVATIAIVVVTSVSVEKQKPNDKRVCPQLPLFVCVAARGQQLRIFEKASFNDTFIGLSLLGSDKNTSEGPVRRWTSVTTQRRNTFVRGEELVFYCRQLFYSEFSFFYMFRRI